MSAAEFYAQTCSDEFHPSRPSLEEELEAGARHIDQTTALLQSHIRGFLVRYREEETTENEKRHGNSTTAAHTRYGLRDQITTIPKSQPVRKEHIEVRPGKYAADLLENSTAGSRSPGTSTGTGRSQYSDPQPRQTTCDENKFLRILENAAKDPFRSAYDKAAPWWIQNPADGATSLCSICRHIDFGILLHSTDPYMYDPPIPLGSLQYVNSKTNCSFCQLVTHIAVERMRHGIGDYLSSDIIKDIECHLIGDPEWDRYSPRIRQICVKLTVHGQPDLIKMTGTIQQIMTDNNRPPEQRFSDTRLVRNQVDLSLLQSWIWTCGESHRTSQIFSTASYPSFEPTVPESVHHAEAGFTQSCEPVTLFKSEALLTVIDVFQQCLVDVRHDTDYVALSYVWGGPQPFQNILKVREALYQPNSISEQNEEIPLTVRDAIRLVASLGYRYVWIDSLCICQDDTEIKMKIINNMGNIYSRAVFTLVAAYGANCHAGLPGVREFSRRTLQKVEAVQGMLLANELLHLREAVESSVWQQRGWTYQENELSKRQLIFSEHQVFWRCNMGTFKEDSGLRDVTPTGTRTLRLRGVYQPIWNSYRRAVNSFTQRTLSFEADVLNAFTGVASLFQGAFKGDLLLGLPETELDVALLWQPETTIRRRVDADGRPLFATWSWAGWVGQVKYKWSRHLLDDQSRVEWEYVCPKTGASGFCTSDQLRAPGHGGHGRWEYVSPSKGTGTPYYYAPERPELWCLHPVAEKNDRSRRVLIHPQYNHLRFKAHVAKFRVSQVHAPTVDDDVISHELEFSCELGSHILCPFSILDADGFAAGTIYLPAHEMAALNEQDVEHEFICLSRRRSDFREDNGLNKNVRIPSPEEDFEDIPDRVQLYSFFDPIAGDMRKFDLRIDSRVFDARRYNMHKSWPVYNVMLIRSRDNVAYRIALGLIHVTAFVQARPQKKLITLG